MSKRRKKPDSSPSSDVKYSAEITIAGHTFTTDTYSFTSVDKDALGLPMLKTEVIEDGKLVGRHVEGLEDN